LGFLIVYFIIWFFKVEIGNWQLFLVSLPYDKIIWDLFTALPFKTDFAALDISINFNLGGLLQSQGEKYLGTNSLVVIIAALFIMSFVLVANRTFRLIHFEKLRRIDRAKAHSLRVLQLGRRKVDLYISEHYLGAPFTGGLRNPYICFPLSSYQKLLPDEIEVVVIHELHHVQNFDIVGTLFIKYLSDIFWFIPGYKWIEQKIDNLREFIADNMAIGGHFLASALTKLKDLPENKVSYSALYRNKELIEKRVRRLSGEIKEPNPRFGWSQKRVKILVMIIITLLVLNLNLK
jgi:beta-lactamase regulating signal transducer with metallopeptidase domain